jgi:hypothetical protein
MRDATAHPSDPTLIAATAVTRNPDREKRIKSRIVLRPRKIDRSALGAAREMQSGGQHTDGSPPHADGTEYPTKKRNDEPEYVQEERPGCRPEILGRIIRARK